MNFFMSTAKIPSSQQGKLIYLGKNQKKQKKRPASQVFFFFYRPSDGAAPWSLIAQRGIQLRHAQLGMYRMN